MFSPYRLTAGWELRSGFEGDKVACPCRISALSWEALIPGQMARIDRGVTPGRASDSAIDTSGLEVALCELLSRHGQMARSYDWQFGKRLPYLLTADARSFLSITKINSLFPISRLCESLAMSRALWVSERARSGRRGWRKPARHSSRFSLDQWSRLEFFPF